MLYYMGNVFRKSVYGWMLIVFFLYVDNAFYADNFNIINM